MQETSGKTPNMRRKRAAMSWTAGTLFFAPHLLYPSILNDSRPDERRCGMEMGLAVLARCDELWVFGSVVSDGMVTEVREAERLGIPVRYFELADGFRLEAIPPY